MQNRKYRWIKYLQAAIDMLLINGAFVIASVLRFSDLRIENEQYYNYYVQLWVFMNLSWVLVTQVLKSYALKPTTEIRNSLSKVFNAIAVQLFIFFLMIVSLKGYYYSRLFLIYFYSILIPALFVFRGLFFNWWRNYLKRDANARKIILLGDSEQSRSLHETLSQHPEYGLRVVLWIKEEKPPKDLNTMEFDEVYCGYQNNSKLVQTWYQFAESHLLRFRFLPDLGLPLMTQADVDFLGEAPIVYPRQEPLSYSHNQILKRLFDILFSSLFLIFIAPWLFTIIGLLIKLTSKGPVFYKQKRSGLNNKTFYCLKFRSMVDNHSEDLQATENDRRITPFGGFLRKHNLDELPQFINVLQGQMSVVGPRPHMVEHTALYRELIDVFMVRHLILPGLTGLAQSRGLRGETTDPEKMRQRVKADVYYLENWSILLDLKIISVTALNMILGKFKGV